MDHQTKTLLSHSSTLAELSRPRPRSWATFDDLTFVPAGLTRIPLEALGEACSTRTVIGSRHAEEPLELGVPVFMAGLGGLSSSAKLAVARGASAAGAAFCASGGLEEGERDACKYLVYALAPSRQGISVHDMRRADAIELSIGRGAPRAGARTPTRHPDMLGPDDMVIKIEELREATDWRVPVLVRLDAARVFDDVRLAAKAGADAIVIDGADGESGLGSASGAGILHEHAGLPTLAAVCEARAALEEIGLFGTVQLVVSGGVRGGADAAKALALGADAVSVSASSLVALGQGALGHEPKYLNGDADALSARVSEFLRAVASDAQAVARACGKSDIHHLDPEDLRALSLESSMVTGLPLAGTNRVAMGGPGWHK